ncbi:hypothetical protein V4762_04515 [Thermodesulfobium sp. 4217-1]|uniref:hypothetical protein n=1 Tax=Thermodesulfobium sp. 4217-1 TaxID=3120013 RepID=UPI003222108D
MGKILKLNLLKLLEKNKFKSYFGKINKNSGNNEKIKYAALLFNALNKNIATVAKRVDIANIIAQEINFSLKNVVSIKTKKYEKKMEQKITKIIGKKIKFISECPKNSASRKVEKRIEKILFKNLIIERICLFSKNLMINNKVMD